MVQKFRVVKYEPSTRIGATTSEALFTTMTTPEKVLGICKDEFTSKEEAENYKTAIWERNPYAHFKVESYF
jgi:hypothetical protein